MAFREMIEVKITHGSYYFNPIYGTINTQGKPWSFWVRAKQKQQFLRPMTLRAVLPDRRQTSWWHRTLRPHLQTLWSHCRIRVKGIFIRWILDRNPRRRDLIKGCGGHITTLISRLILKITWDIRWASSAEPCWRGVPHSRCYVLRHLQGCGRGLVQEPKTPRLTFSTGRKVTHTKRFHGLENIPWCGFIHHILVECSKENRRFFSRDDTDSLRSEALWSREQVGHLFFTWLLTLAALVP